MKKFTILAFALLTGCSTIQDVMVAPFDNNEYLLIDKVRTDAQIGKCDQQSIDTLYSDSLELNNYSQYLPRDNKTALMTQKLFIVVDELHKKQNPSVVYCGAKLNIVSTIAEEIQKVTGNRPR